MQSSIVNKKSSKNNDNVEYCEPVALHNSSKAEISVLPFFIKHSDPAAERDLSIKLIKSSKSAGLLVPEAEINLNQTAALRLRDKLNELFALKKVTDNGNFLVVRMGEGQSVDLSGLDSSEVAKAVISILENEDIAANIDAVDFSDDLAFAFRNSMRIKSLIKAMTELKDALDVNDSEQFFQDWCESNGWIFGNQYILKDDERRISRNDNVDFLAASVISGFRDIIEIKKPSFAVLNYDASHDSFYFSAEISKAIGQCHRYLDVFSEDAVRGLRDNPEIVAYHPRATIVVGRSNDWDDDKHRALHGLNSRLSGISVLTYDHLLTQGSRLIEMLQNNQTTSEEYVPDDFDCDEDELPF